MMEIPEAINLANQWNKYITGKTIKNVEAGHTKHGFAFYSGDPAEYPEFLNGKTIGEAKAIAGSLEIEVEDFCLLFGEGPNIRYVEEGKIPEKHQLLIEFTDGSFIYVTVSMYAAMLIYPQGTNNEEYYLIACEKPNPLSAQFDWDYFYEHIVQQADPKISAKALLATQQRIPGLGNGCLQDILFNAKVNPVTKIKNLDEQDFKRIFHSIKDTFKQMSEQGGRDTEKDIFGEPGGYRTILSKKTYQYPCLTCGDGIVKKAFLGGSVYYCPSCQPIIK